jgi:hypothetical protein
MQAWSPHRVCIVNQFNVYSKDVDAHRRDVVSAHWHKIYDEIFMDRHRHVILGQAYRKRGHMRQYQACDPPKLGTAYCSFLKIR